MPLRDDGGSGKQISSRLLAAHFQAAISCSRQFWLSRFKGEHVPEMPPMVTSQGQELADRFMADMFWVRLFVAENRGVDRG